MLIIAHMKSVLLTLLNQCKQESEWNSPEQPILKREVTKMAALLDNIWFHYNGHYKEVASAERFSPAFYSWDKGKRQWHHLR